MGAVTSLGTGGSMASCESVVLKHYDGILKSLDRLEELCDELERYVRKDEAPPRGQGFEALTEESE